MLRKGLLLSSNRDSQPLPGGKDLCGCGERVGSCSLKERGSNPGSRIAAPPEVRDLPSGPRNATGGGLLLVRDATFTVYIGSLQLT